MPEDQEIWLTRRELATEFDVNPATAGRWTKLPGWPAARPKSVHGRVRDTYPLSLVTAFLASLGLPDDDNNNKRRED